MQRGLWGHDTNPNKAKDSKNGVNGAQTERKEWVFALAQTLTSTRIDTLLLH